MIISPALNRACLVAGISIRQIREQDKRREVVPMRFHAYWHMVIVEGFSYPKTGRLVHRDHTTVMYGCRQHSMHTFGTRPKASLAEMLDAYADHCANRGEAWVNSWLQGYGEFQIPQGPVEIVEEAKPEEAA